MKPSAKTKSTTLASSHAPPVSSWNPNPGMENLRMNNLMKLYIVMKSLIEREEGQDLVEYALVVALIAFGAITGMGYLATGLNHAFSQIALTLIVGKKIGVVPPCR